MSRVTELELTRTAADRRAFALDGVGTLRMNGWASRAASAEAGDRQLAVLDGTARGRRPVKVTLDDPRGIDPGLVLFAVFVVRGLANDGVLSSVVSAG